jgi:hypothetical protein
MNTRSIGRETWRCGPGPIGVNREIHREHAKIAKKVGEPAHNPLALRLSMATTTYSAIWSISSFVLFIACSLRITNVSELVFLTRNSGWDLRNIKVSNS